MANVQGYTDFAAKIDETTKTLCFVEGGTQALNATSTGWAAGRLAFTSGIAWWNYIISAVGFVAAASSGVASGQQFKWTGKIGEEIAARQTTQDLNVTTNEIFNEEVDYFGASLDGVADLSLDVPDKMDAPTDAPTLPSQNPFPTQGQASIPNTNQPQSSIFTPSSSNGNNPFAKSKK